MPRGAPPIGSHTCSVRSPSHGRNSRSHVSRGSGGGQAIGATTACAGNIESGRKIFKSNVRIPRPRRTRGSRAEASRCSHRRIPHGFRRLSTFLQSRTTAGPASPAGGRGSNGGGERLDKAIGRLVFYCATGDFRKSSVLVQASLAASGSYVFPFSSKNPCCAFV